MACIPELCKFPSIDSCQKRFLWTNKEVDLPQHPVVGLVFQVGDTETFPETLGFESLGPFFQSKQGPCFTAVEEDGGDERLVELELACEADSDGTDCFEDGRRPGRPVSARNAKPVLFVKKLMKENPHITIHEICERCDVLIGTADRNVRNGLNRKQKLCQDGCPIS